MRQVPIPITCPNCGAGLWDLEQTGYHTKRGVPVFEYHCRICETHFSLRSKHCMRTVKSAMKMAERLEANESRPQGATA